MVRVRMVILDRDGVLNLDRPDCVKSPDELILIPGAAEAVARLNRAGIAVAVATNQSVVGRGIIDERMLARIHEKLRVELAKAGGHIDDLRVAPDAPDAATERRKPGTGMLREALEKFAADPAESPVIGDALRDLSAAAELGCPRILVHTGKGVATLAAGIPPSLEPVAVYDDLWDAVDALIEQDAKARAGEGPAPQPRRWGGALAASVFFAVALWAAGLAWFAALIPDHVADPGTRTDAIVVLTGGAERIKTGLDLLAAGDAERLLITGVHREVTVAEILRLAPGVPESLSQRIDLGYEANNTSGNAAEAARWIKAHGYRSLRLVTSNYHLPRSMLEFRRVLPDVEIAANPVFPASVSNGAWWRHPASFALVAGEYTKYLVAVLRQAAAPPPKN